MAADGIYLVAGLCLLLAVFLPTLLSRFAVSSPMVLVGVGLLIGISPLPEGLSLDQQADRAVVEHVTELTILIALMGVGLALDRPLRWSRRTWGHWSATWRLLGVAMPLCIGGVAVLGWWVGGLGIAAAVLLGAVLAPTDPVLASDVQVGGPQVAEELAQFEEGLSADTSETPRQGVDEVRFNLTAEAGFNDGLAFPFVYLAILLAAGGFGAADLAQWVGWYAVAKVLIGVLAGAAVGWSLGRVAFRSRRASLRLAEQGEPLLVLAALLAAYGGTELIGGYGFLAVFVCALFLRGAERASHYHQAMHDVVERLERLMTLVVLLFLGITATRGLLDDLDGAGVLVALALVLVVRPLAGWLSLSLLPRHGSKVGGLAPSERWAVAFFGVRGVGSLYYLAYATGQADFDDVGWLWSTVGFTIITSVFVHGVAATPVMDWLDRRRLSRLSAAAPSR